MTPDEFETLARLGIFLGGWLAGKTPKDALEAARRPAPPPPPAPPPQFNFARGFAHSAAESANKKMLFAGDSAASVEAKDVREAAFSAARMKHTFDLELTSSAPESAEIVRIKQTISSLLEAARQAHDAADSTVVIEAETKAVHAARRMREHGITFRA